MKALAISDKIIDFIYSPAIRQRFEDVDLVLSCGDLPYYYLEYIISTLDKPLFFVRGNHASVVEYTTGGPRSQPWGGQDLDGTVVNFNGLLMAGFEGSIRYNDGPFQYTDAEMYLRVARIVPRLVLNRLLYGRYLDVLITHSPPKDVQDESDRCHQGFAAFRWLLKQFRPSLMLHGHIHVYHPGTVTRTTFHETEVLNCYGYREIDLTPYVPARPVPERRETHDRSAHTIRLRESNVESFPESD